MYSFFGARNARISRPEGNTNRVLPEGGAQLDDTTMRFAHSLATRSGKRAGWRSSFHPRWDSQDAPRFQVVAVSEFFEFFLSLSFFSTRSDRVAKMNTPTLLV